jgi:uncharacterized membrane protein YuzA (DUF378 family)
MEKISKYLNIFSYVLLGICALIALIFFVSGPNVTYKDAPHKDGEILFIAAYIFLAFGVLLIGGFFVKSIVEHPKRIKFMLLGLAATAVLVFICYLAASDTVYGLNKELAHATSPATIRWSETSIIVAYILFCAAFVALGFASIRSLFFKRLG